AGIYVECTLAALATFVWWNTQPGLFNSLMLSTMFICSVNTILFNANPLLRYDGYYVMADWLEIPNLRIKSTQFFTYLFQEKVLGLEVPVQSYMPRSRRFLFVFYAIASYLYRWLVTFSILFFLYQFLKPYKLGSISAILAVGSFVPLVVMPLYQMFKFVGQPGRMRKVKKARAAAFLAAFVAIVAAILMIPTPLHISGTLVLEPANPAPVYAEVPGQVVRYYVHDGDYVQQDDPIADLINLEKQRERQTLQEQIDTNMSQHDMYLLTTDTAEHDRAKVHLDLAQKLEPAVATLTEQIGKLQLRAPRAGVVIGMPEHETLGQWLRPEPSPDGGSKMEPLCKIADPRKLEAHILLDQSDVDLVKQKKQPRAWVKIYGSSQRTYTSHVAEVSMRNLDDVPPELSNLAGGEIATKPDQKTGEVKPLTAVYEVVIPIDNSDLALLPEGQRGFAKIDAGYATFGWWLWRLIAKTFHFTL
ncbi:MAG TPA: HlyD family efflux transporter periplasmic adaptor subunit, partial [Isosphaeraceae bacterium]|nr:HlyD family efflux transporter periplasmic adaptor subunit [Isosphaeraceae bacterium]